MKRSSAAPTASLHEETRVHPQRFRGVVTRAGKMAKTVTVSINRRVWHRLLRKQLRQTRSLLVHDPNDIAHEGMRVVIEKMRPISKRKHFRVLSILSDTSASAEGVSV